MVSVVAGNVFYGFRRWFVYGFRRGRKMLFYGFRRWILGGFCRRRRIQNFRMYRAIPRFLLCLGLVSVAGLFMVSVVAGKRIILVSVVVCLWFPSWQRTFFFYGFRRWLFLWFPASTGLRLSLQWKPYTIQKNVTN